MKRLSIILVVLLSSCAMSLNPSARPKPYKQKPHKVICYSLIGFFSGYAITKYYQ